MLTTRRNLLPSPPMLFALDGGAHTPALALRSRHQGARAPPAHLRLRYWSERLALRASAPAHAPSANWHCALASRWTHATEARAQAFCCAFVRWPAGRLARSLCCFDSCKSLSLWKNLAFACSLARSPLFLFVVDSMRLGTRDRMATLHQLCSSRVSALVCLRGIREWNKFAGHHLAFEPACVSA